MFAAACRVAKEIIRNSKSDDNDLPIIPPGSLPESYSLAQLHANLSTSDGSANQEDKLINLLILSSCFHYSTRLSREPGDGASITQVLLWLSKATLPDSSIIPQNETTPHGQNSSADEALRITRQKGATGLLSLQLILDLFHPLPATLEPQVLLSVVAFTSARDPWTTDLALSTATSFLSKYEHQAHTSGFIIEYVLQQFIRPLFSKSKRPEAITASGRKAMPSSAPPRRFEAKDLDEKSRPWMFEVPYTIVVFEWAVLNSSSEIVNSNFNLYVPPLLTLLDSTDTLTRSRALSILSTFLPLLTPKLLTQTGLGEVFEDAITPTLMFLPNLTPVDESVQLLEPTYEALLVLGDVLYSGDIDGKGGEAENQMHFWDRVMRKGVLMGYMHSSEHPAIVEVLVRNMDAVISKMGIYAVKHLKDILPILSTTLTDPFATSRPSLLLIAVKTIRTTILNCWPRISEPRHRIEITSAIALSWTNVSQSTTEDFQSLEEIRRELSVAGKLLVRAVRGEVDIRKELEPLFAVNDGLRQIFGMVEDG